MTECSINFSADAAPLHAARVPCQGMSAIRVFKIKKGKR